MARNRNNEAEKYRKRFMQIMNETFGYSTMMQEEGEDDDMNDPQGQGGDPGMGDGMPPQGGDPGMGGGMPPQGGDPGMGGGMPPQGGDPGMGGDPMGGDQGIGGDPGMGGDPMGGDPGMGDPMGMDDPMGGDEDVIDVDDLTNAQEKGNDKVNAVGRDVVKVNHRITQLIQAIDQMQSMIDNNNRNIADLNREFQKRNPTQTEKLNLRSLDSYPFNVRPDEYWDNKARTSNYYAYGDNNEPTTAEYQITNSDVDDFDEREMADSFYVDEDDIQNINKIFGKI